MAKIKPTIVPRNWVYRVDTDTFEPLPSVPTHELIYTCYRFYFRGWQPIIDAAKLELSKRLPDIKDQQLVTEIYSLLFGEQDD